MPHVFGQQDRILGPRRHSRPAFPGSAPSWRIGTPSRKQHLQDLLHFGQLHHAGNQFVDHRRRGLLQFVDQVLGGVAGEDFVGMAADGLGQVRGDHAARLDHRVAVASRPGRGSRLRSRRPACRRPARAWRCRGILPRGRARIHGQELGRIDRAFGHRHVGDLDAILVLVEPHVVADADLGQDDADLGGHVLPDALDALQQVAAALGIGQADQPHADLDFHRIDGQVVFDALLRPAWRLRPASWPRRPPWPRCSRRVERHGQRRCSRRRSAAAESAAGW